MALRQWFSSIRSITSFLGQPSKTTKTKKSSRSGLGLLQLEDRWVPTIVPVIPNYTFDSMDPYQHVAMSADGNLVAFETQASLSLDDTNDKVDVYVKNISEDTLVRISTNYLGQETYTGDSADVSMSADGRYVVFSSSATDLVSSNTNSGVNVYVRDMQTNVTTLVSCQEDGTQLEDVFAFRAKISADGSTIVFQNYWDIYVKKMTGELIQINKDEFGTVIPTSSAPSISADGSRVAFLAEVEGVQQVYVKDWNMDGTGSLVPVSTIDGSTPANASCDFASISADGNFVVFESEATNLGLVATGDMSNTYVKNLITNEMKVANTSQDGVLANTSTMRSSISADGTYVAFSTFASNLVEGDNNGFMDTFIKNLQTGAIARLSQGSQGESDGYSFLPSITGDARHVMFLSTASNLVPNYVPAGLEYYLADALVPVNLWLSNTSIAEKCPAGLLVGTLRTESVEMDATFTYTLVTGEGDTDNTLFEIDGDQLVTKVWFNYDTKPNCTVRIQTKNGAGDTFEKIFSIDVTRVDTRPFFTSPGTVYVEENTTGDIHIVEAESPDTSNPPLSYSIVGGPDGNLFWIASVSGEMGFKTSPDYENPHGSTGTNTYYVTVQVSDGTNYATQNMVIHVTNVVEPPVFTSPTTVNVAENTTAVLTVASATYDYTGQTPNILYSIENGPDQYFFQINNTTGELSFISTPDYENPQSAAGTNTYTVVVQASDGVSVTLQEITVTVTNVVEAPVLTSPSTATVEENTTAVMTVAATSNESTNPTPTYNYSILGGADAGLFQINLSTGELSFKVAPDYENPTSFNSTNTYYVTVQVSDEVGTVTQDITVTVTNVVESPVIMSPSTATVEENTTAVMTVVATSNESTDPTPTINYMIVGGADANFFQIDFWTGELSFKVAPDYENPQSAAGNNIYQVTVVASTGVYNVEQQITVTVTNVVDPPVFTNPNTVTFAENSTEDVLTLHAVSYEQPAPSLSYTFAGGPDAHCFVMNSVTGELGFVIPPNFENPQDSTHSNTYHFTVKVSDGFNEVTQDIMVTVTNANEAPTDINLSNDAISAGAAIGSVVGHFGTTDPDANDQFTYSLVNDAEGIFTLTNGSLFLAKDLRTTQVTSFDVIVRTTDLQGLNYDKTFTINVVNQAPVVDDFTDRTVVVDGRLGPITFYISDDTTLAVDLHILVASSNQTVLPTDKVILNGSGNEWSLTLYPVAEGNSTISIIVKDANGATTTKSFVVTSVAQLPGTYQDDFLRGDSTNLGPNWLVHSGNAIQSSNSVISTAPVTVATVYGLLQKDTMVDAYVMVGTTVPGSSCLVARYSGASSAPSMYLGALVYHDGALYSRISKVVNGVATILSETTAIPLQYVYHLRFEVVNDSLKLFVDDKLVEFAYDTSLSTAGLTGIRLTNGNRLGLFSANDITLASVALPPNPSQSNLEDFTFDDGIQLTRNWTDRLGNLSIQDSQVVGVGGKCNVSTLNLPATRDIGAQADVTFTALGQSVGIALRYSGQPGAADQNMYWGALQWLNGNDQQAVIYRNVNGTWTLLASAQLTGLGGALRFEAEGRSLKLFVDGQRVLTVYDSALSTGVVGLRSGMGGTADNFFAYKTSLNVEGDHFEESFDDNLTHQLSANWSERSGAFVLDSSNSQGTLSGANTAILQGVSMSDVVVTAVIQPPVGNLRSTGLVARYSGVGDDNMYWGALNVHSVGTESKYLAQIWKNVDGVWTCLNSNAVPIEVADAEGKELRFEVVSTSLKLFLGDKLYAFAHDSSITAPGSVGIRSGSGASLDDFSYSVRERISQSADYFLEPFNADQNPRNTLSNKWQEQSGFISVETGHAVGGSANEMNFATLNSPDVFGTTLSADLYFTGANQTVQLVGNYLGKNGSGEDNMLLASATTQENGDLLIRLVKVLDGVTTELKRTTKEGYFTPGQFSALNPELMFVLAGDYLIVFVDERRLFDVHDNSLQHGTVGIRMSAGAGLDNFFTTMG